MQVRGAAAANEWLTYGERERRKKQNKDRNKHPLERRGSSFERIMSKVYSCVPQKQRATHCGGPQTDCCCPGAMASSRVFTEHYCRPLTTEKKLFFMFLFTTIPAGITVREGPMGVEVLLAVLAVSVFNQI